MDSDMHGGRLDRLAPVIPLFGDRNRPEASEPRASSDRADGEASGAERTVAERTVVERAVAEQRAVAEAAAIGQAAAGRTFGGRPAERAETSPSSEPGWHQTWLDDDAPPDDLVEERAPLLHDAQQLLLKRLRTRSLSIREARTVLVQAGLDQAEVDMLTDRFVRDRYLDDAALAEQLVHKANGRKGQGRQAIALSLTRRGIPREMIDAALDALPDDDADRALEFARAKAKGMADLDRDVALRRLAGQLARRGYGSTALSAARRALDELPATRRSVRFD